MSATLEEIREHVAISKYTLDDDNTKQPQLMDDVTQGCTMARDAKRRAKKMVEWTYAKLDAELREQLAAEQGKLSETQIKMRITLLPAMVEAENDLLVCERNEDEWLAMLDTLKTRGYSLSNTGSLYAANYFSRESSGASSSRRLDERAAKARAGRPRPQRWED